MIRAGSKSPLPAIGPLAFGVPPHVARGYSSISYARDIAEAIKSSRKRSLKIRKTSAPS
jgi:hypothetical protein